MNTEAHSVAVKILCVPGAGHALAEDHWFDKWRSGLANFVDADGYHDLQVLPVPFRYRDDFKSTLVEPDGFADALSELAFGMEPEVFGRLFRHTGGLDPLAEALKWRAAVLVQWARNRQLRDSIAENLVDTLIEEQPDIILAFSLGSLITYDALRRMSSPFLSSRYLITFGAQLGTPFVRNMFAGRIVGIPVKRWFNLYNRLDRVFTSPLYLQDENYQQVNTVFDNSDPLDHTAIATGEGTIGYLDHYATRQLVWPVALNRSPASPFLKSVRRALRTGSAFKSPDHRALLIGVDHYEQDSIGNLSGCVNDTYLLSQTLQQAGFPTENIRLIHNHRATRDAIMNRIDWLLDDIEDGEFRLLHFSGHGAQLESYGVGETVDRLDECLCPYDFNWSTHTAILDDFICELYSQLSYNSHFVIVLDCCHSGGMARNGQSVRGLNPPGDVAHRGLYYRAEDTGTAAGLSYGSWRRRGDTRWEEMPEALRTDKSHHPMLINPDFFAADRNPTEEEVTMWMGTESTIRKLGRSPSLRRLAAAEFRSERKALGHKGPYLPTILEACAEGEPAMEHTQGSAAYGAFTFALVQSLLVHFKPGETMSYERLLSDAKKVMSDLGYTQTPGLLCPRKKKEVVIPRVY